MEVRFDFASDTPLYAQLRNQIVVAIARGELAPGDRLPTVRALAEESGVNTMTISRAYQALCREGYITTDRRNGAQVRTVAAVPPETLEGLRLRLAELRQAGLSGEDAAALCRKLYEEGCE